MPAIPHALLEALDRGQLIVCVGPELACSAGLPSAAQLAAELLADANASERHIELASVQQRIIAGRIHESLELLARHLGSRFQRVVEQTLADRGRPVPALARAVAALREQLRAVYTTGIDRLLERAFADEWPSHPSPRPDVVQRSKLIFKLCGTLEFPETWVLTREAFDREFGERSLRRQLLAACYRAHCVLFVGFDPDSELAERLFSIVDSVAGGEQLPSHFVVVERCSREQQVLLERRGLHVLQWNSVALLQALVKGHRVRDAQPEDVPACPYPGLRSFDGSFAAVFHGRRAEISQAAARLGGPGSRHRRWLAIEGSSGVGKSSFVHAGLIPALRKGFAEATPSRWLIAALRPGHRPLRSLRDALGSALIANEAECDAALKRLSEELSDELDPAERTAQFVREHIPIAAGLLLVVDQLEELVTLTSPDERARFGACLTILLEQQLIYLVTTLRSDFIAELSSAAPGLGRLLNEHAERYNLAPISRVGLRLAIAEPAAQLDVSFEGELVERVAADAEQHLRARDTDDDGVVRTDDSTLPLVAHVLRGLWEARAAEDRSITLAQYRALGGVSGALSRSADALLATLDKKQRVRARALLLRMVNLDDGRLARRTLPRSDALELAGGGEQGERLLGLLSGAVGPRLLVIRRERRDVLVDLVHEALLREWDTLRGWIAADQAQLARDEALARRAAAWVSQDRPRRGLPRGPERRELLRGRPHGREAEIQRAYQRAMTRAARLRGGSWVGFIAVLGVFTTAVLNEIDAKHQQLVQRDKELDGVIVERDTERLRQQQIADREEMKRLLLEHRCREALEEILGALSCDKSSELQELLAEAVRCEFVVGVGSEVGGRGARVTALSVHPEGHEVWIGRSNGNAQRWDLGDHQLHPVASMAQRVDQIRFAPASDRVALSSSSDDSTVLRDAEGTAVGVSVKGISPVFSADGRSFVTREGPRVRMYDTSEGAQIWASEAEDRPITTVELSPRSEYLYHSTSGQSGSQIVMTPLITRAGVEHLPIPGYLRDIAITPDGRYLASTSDDNYARLWSTATLEAAAAPLKLRVDNKAAKFVRFSPNGSMLATLLTNDSITITDLDMRTFAEISEIDRGVRPSFAPDSRWLLTAGNDRSVNLWSATTGEEVARIDIDGKVTELAYSPRGESFVAGLEDGRLLHWRVDGENRWQDPAAHGHGIKALTFSRENPRRLVWGSSAGRVQAWNIGADEPTTARWQEEGWVMALASFENDEILAVSDRGTWRRWTASIDSEQEAFSGLCASRRSAINPAGDVLAVACDDGSVQIWRPYSASPTVSRLTATVHAVAVSERGRRVALGKADGTIEVLRIEGDRVEHESVRKPSGRVSSLAVDDEGQTLISGGNDEFVEIWTLSRPGDPLRLPMGGNNVEAVALSSKYSRVAAGDDHDGTVTVWNLNGDQLFHFEAACDGHRVSALSFSPDGELLAAGCSNGSVYAWPLDIAAQVELACRRLARVSDDSSLPSACKSEE